MRRDTRSPRVGIPNIYVRRSCVLYLILSFVVRYDPIHLIANMPTIGKKNQSQIAEI